MSLLFFSKEKAEVCRESRLVNRLRQGWGRCSSATSPRKEVRLRVSHFPSHDSMKLELPYGVRVVLVWSIRRGRVRTRASLLSKERAGHVTCSSCS